MSTSEVIARGLVVTGNPAVVYHNTDDDHNESYSLDILPAVTPVGAGSTGFSSLDDLKRYLSSHGEETFTNTDAKGKSVDVTRQGLGTATTLFSFPTEEKKNEPDAVPETEKEAPKSDNPALNPVPGSQGNQGV